MCSARARNTAREGAYAPHTEQNNPIEQREQLEHQAGGEQQKLDEDYQQIV